MCVDGETLLLPDIKKPYIPRKRLDGSLDYYKALLRTIQKEQLLMSTYWVYQKKSMMLIWKNLRVLNI